MVSVIEVYQIFNSFKKYGNSNGYLSQINYISVWSVKTEIY